MVSHCHKQAFLLTEPGPGAKFAWAVEIHCVDNAKNVPVAGSMHARSGIPFLGVFASWVMVGRPWQSKPTIPYCTTQQNAIENGDRVTVRAGLPIT